MSAQPWIAVNVPAMHGLLPVTLVLHDIRPERPGPDVLHSCRALFREAAHNQAVYKETVAAITRYEGQSQQKLTKEQKDNVAHTMSQYYYGGHHLSTFNSFKDVPSRTRRRYTVTVRAARARAERVRAATEARNNDAWDTDDAEDLWFSLEATTEEQ